MTLYKELLHREKTWALCRKLQECYSVACFIWESQTSFQILIRPQNSLWNQQIKQQRESHCLFSHFLACHVFYSAWQEGVWGGKFRNAFRWATVLLERCTACFKSYFTLRPLLAEWGFPAPTWCFTFPVLCRAAFRGTGFQALGTSVETEIEADAIAKTSWLCRDNSPPTFQSLLIPDCCSTATQILVAHWNAAFGGYLCWKHPWLHPRASDKGEGDGQVSAWLW